MTDKLQHAEGITVRWCDCGDVHIFLQDDNGDVFAVATLSLEDAVDFGVRFQNGTAVAVESRKAQAEKGRGNVH